MAAGEIHGCELHAGGAALKFTISNLRQNSTFMPVVANRIWKAWWEPDGHPFSEVQTGIDEIVTSAKFPFCLVAHQDSKYVGSVLGISSDLDERPNLTPWVAALWVEPEFRRQGVAVALVKEALAELFATCHEAAYLCATAEKRGMYQNQGWQLIEEKVGEEALDVFETMTPKLKERIFS